MIYFNIIPVNGPDSTNNHLKALHKQGVLHEGSVILADYQSKGRGRGNNAWYSGKNLNILMSVLLFPGIPADRYFFLTEVVSLALSDLLIEMNIIAEIKWPNDIYVEGGKIAGILIENSLTNVTIETSVIGVGFNINEEIFPDELPNPVSLKQIVGKDTERNLLVNKLLEKLKLRYTELRAGQYTKMHSEYNARLFGRKQWCRFSHKEQEFEASIISVQENGEIILETKERKRKQFSFGELTMIL